MNFESTVPKIFKEDPSLEYINPCCVGGDEILNELRPDIAAQMAVKQDTIEIYQEDWGWALEFQKEGTIYLLGVSNETEDGDERSLIVFDPQAFRKVKKIFFSKTIEAQDESEDFSRKVVKVLENSGYKIN